MGKRYLVKADISNCFGSIYTHAIPRALIGKESAKQDRNDTKWYNEIDEKTRLLNYNETHGLLIGPHTSNLISEIILVAVYSVMSRKYKYIRKINDYSCYIETKEKAEQFLLDLSQELKKFGLSLNNKKQKLWSYLYLLIMNGLASFNSIS
ncbi:RNA-directed DNA polymerase [Campylobacter concisus]|uniref:RNA-directed DNA polymerase n=1 Tax=Campylobacter concisus TaxID=199 RepID=UPI003D24E2C9